MNDREVKELEEAVEQIWEVATVKFGLDGRLIRQVLARTLGRLLQNLLEHDSIPTERHGRVWAVGTTVVRALEAAVDATGHLAAGSGETRLLILPGYRFQVVDRLVTNFHLPRSTLVMLVSAFAGWETIRAAYHHAITQRYRFYSYGDAIVIT